MNPGMIDAKILNARDFASKCIKDRLKDLSPSEYYTLQISKFILLKEKLIKKDKNSNLHFDYSLYHEYVPVIEEICDTLIKNSKFLNIKRSFNVIIEPVKYDNDLKLKSCILLLHKVRDALAHGSYEIDYSSKTLYIYNESNEFDIYTSLPLELIEKFTYIDYPKRLRDKKIDSSLIPLSNPLINNNIYNYKDNNYTYNYSDKLKYDINPKIIYNENVKAKIEELEVLKQLIKYAFQIGLPHESLDKITELLKEYEFDKKLGKVTSVVVTIKSLINEMSKIIGIRSRNGNPYAFVATYNYMQIYLSNKYGELWSTRPPILSHLRLSKLHPSFDKYSDIHDVINETVKTMVKRTRKALSTYNSISNPTYKEKILGDINKSFRESINLILKQLGSHNMETIAHIRNAIDHANILDSDGRILLYDMDDQNDSGTKNFMCLGSCKDYYDLIETLDLNILTPLTDKELVGELKPILDESLFKEFSLIVDEIAEINKQFNI